MVLISSTKYACETCIKGHRSSACKHTDRPLFEIKKKGRPVTQCEHCRELRKTKQVHVKCICESKEQITTAAVPSKKGGGTKVPATAAFPNGLPESMEASIAQLLAEGSSDSDHSGEQSSASNCNCKTGGQCHCCTPRKPARRRPSVRDSKEDSHHPDSSKHSHPSSLFSSPPPAHVLARIAELRPVLPRPSKVDTFTGPLHDPSSGTAHGHSNRHHHHAHENVYFSPYGRAYEHIHAPDHVLDQGTFFSQAGRHMVPQQAPLFSEESPSHIMAPGMPTDNLFPSACTCGDSCRCPGCSQHNNAPVSAAGAFSSCSNPEGCSFCLDCTILALPSSLPPDTMSTLFDTSQSQDIDEWLRQASLPNAVTQYPLSLSQAPPVHSDIVMTQFTQFAPTSDWEKTPTPQLTQSLPHYRTMASTCCNGLCQCSQGSCSCPAECCGCCQGCQCEQPCQDRGYRTTFTVSGERKSCCSPREHHSDSNSPGRHLRPNDGMTAGGYTLNVAIPSRSYTSGGHDLLSVPDMQSRSSSSSSGSSHRSSAQMAGHSFISPTHTRPNMVKTFSQSSPLPVAALSGPNTRPTFMGSYRSAQSSASVSPQPTSPMSGVSCGDSAGYASSSAGSDGSHGDPQFDAYAHYNPSLDAMHLRGN